MQTKMFPEYGFLFLFLIADLKPRTPPDSNAYLDLIFVTVIFCSSGLSAAGPSTVQSTYFG